MIEYNILNKQSEGECTSPDPAKNYCSTKVAVSNFLRVQDCYFLFFIFRIATIKDAVVKIIINSSYVLISIILSVMLGSDGARPPTTWVNILYSSLTKAAAYAAAFTHNDAHISSVLPRNNFKGECLICH